jgi:CHAT domain-containing protein
VFVVPDGSLHLVNFAALPSAEGGVLLESGPLLHHVSAERDLVPEAPDVKAKGELLVLGGANFDETKLFAALAPPSGDGPARSPASDTADAQLTARLDAAAASPDAATMFRGERAACGDLESIRFEALPGTLREAREVASLWRETAARREDDSGVSSLTGSRADETTLKRVIAGHRVVHLATHGFFLGSSCVSALDGSRGIGGLAETSVASDGPTVLPREAENPLRLSGLALAGANHREQAGPDEDDGILTAEEIGALDLSDVEWAVLSACDTGVGDVRAGEGVFGLRRAFRIAGARTLILSLWSVDDESTREWMTALYAARLGARLSTAESVREASLTVLRHRRESGESTHPFYWAAFVAAGDWR